MKALLPALVCLAFTAPVSGQIRIAGRVIDDFTEAPLSQVQVTLLAPDGSALSRAETSETGTFEFEVSRVKAVRIRARRLSYETTTTPLLHFDNRIFFQVEVRLDPEAILLAPLEIVAWSEVDGGSFLDGFRQRLQTGNGIYITREEVEARHPMFVTDLLREVPGLQVTGSGTGTRPVVQISRGLGRNCASQIFVDGFLLNRRITATAGARPSDFRIDDAVSPTSVEGIEVYKGLSTVPAEFLNPDAECGVIAIWTRRGGGRK